MTVLYKHIAECCQEEVWVNWKGQSEQANAPCCPICGEEAEIKSTDIQIEVNEG